jgi:hypothetical protein
MANGHAIYYGLVCRTHGKILINGVPDHLNYCVIFIVYMQFTDMATGHKIKPSRLWVETFGFCALSGGRQYIGMGCTL